MRFSRIFLLLLGAGLLTLAGCKGDESISRYEVTHDDREPIQLRVAMVPHGEFVWYFRLTGPKAQVEEHAKAFEDLVNSVKFIEPKDVEKDPPITWTEPKGWEKEPAAAGQFALYRIETQPKAMEMKVTFLEQPKNERDKKNSFLKNMQRWQRQMYVPLSYDEEDANKYTKTTKLGDDQVTWIELNSLGVHTVSKRTPAVAQRKMADDLPPMFPAAKKKQPTPSVGGGKRGVPFAYDVPKGWVEREPQDQFTKLLFEVADGERVAAVTFTSVGGDLAANIQRWRKQVDLPAVSDAEAVKSARLIKVAGIESYFVDVANPKGPAKKNRIVVAVVPLGQFPWYIRMSGPHDWVGQNINTFETFVKTLKLADR